MPTPLNLVGQRFGKLLVVGKLNERRNGVVYWKYACDCGNYGETQGGALRTGKSLSCGCASKDWCRTHGMEATPVYNAYHAMLQRCTNPKVKFFPRYGGRGIEICDRWKSFENFYADMGDRPAGMTLGRIDNNGNYEPSNCRWETVKQQLRNRELTVFVEYDGNRIALSELAEIKGIKPKLLRARLKSGWDINKAVIR